MTGGGSSIPEVRALLRTLAAGRDVAELGAAFGEGAAAMAATARSVVTVELDPGRAEAARRRLEGVGNVELLEGDCYELLRGRRPFGLVFADGGRPLDWEAILALVAPGGILVKDDLTPGHPSTAILYASSSSATRGSLQRKSSPRRKLRRSSPSGASRRTPVRLRTSAAERS